MPRGAEQRGSGAPEVARERGGVRPPSAFYATDRVLPDPMRPYKVAATLIKHLLRNTENYAELIVVLHAYRYFNIAVNTDCEILTVELCSSTWRRS